MRKFEKLRLIPFIKVLFVFVVFTSCEDNYLVINPFEAEGVNINYSASANDSLNVAVVSMECFAEKDKNIGKLIKLVDSIMLVYPQTELIAFGETITGWYYKDKDYIATIAEPIPGNMTDTIAGFCRRYGIYTSLGLTENFNGLLYNSLVLINPNGQIEAIHRKVKLTPEDEESGYSSCKNQQVVHVKNFKIGLMICADVNSLWLTKQYINADIDIALSSFATPVDVPNFNIISRRISAWQIFANRYGDEGNSNYSGLIYISDPAGNVVVYNSGKESIINYTITK